MDHLLQLASRELDLKVLRPGGISGKERKVDFGLGHRRQFNLGLFRRFLQPLEHHLVFADVDAGVLLKLGDQPIHDADIDIVSTEVSVAVG